MTMINGLPESASNIDVFYQDTLRRFTEADFFRRYRVHGVNRIPLSQFKSLRQSRLLAKEPDNLTAADRRFVRFSLERNNAVAGKHYIALAIIKSGQDNGADGYRAPKLSIDNGLIFKAENVLNHLSYRQVSELILKQQLDFKYSVPEIDSLDSLQAEIIHRYGHSRPQLSTRQIIDLGVGVVWFRWVGYIDKANKLKYLAG